MKALPGGILTVLAVAAVTLVAAEHLHLTSTAPSGTVTVDGRHDDWTGDLTPMGTDPFAVQIVNDQSQPVPAPHGLGSGRSQSRSSGAA